MIYHDVYNQIRNKTLAIVGLIPVYMVNNIPYRKLGLAKFGFYLGFFSVEVCVQITAVSGSANVHIST